MNRYWAFASDLFPPLHPQDGFPEAEIARLEKRFHETLAAYVQDVEEGESPAKIPDAFVTPAALREIYLRSAKRKDLHATQDRLQMLPLDLDQDHVIICDENQHVANWGIRIVDLGLADPPVYVSTDDDNGSWQIDFDTTSGFLLFCLFWERVNGDACAMRTLTGAQFSKIESSWQSVPFEDCRRAGGMRVFVRPGVALVAYGDSERGFTAHFGSQHVELLEAVLREVQE